jgi:hypothetical protein
MAAQLLHEDVGGGGQEDPELIGQEARAAGAIDLQAVFELLDAVLDVSALAVDPFVDPAGRLAQVGDEEAGIVFGTPARVAHDFGLEDDAPAA